MNNSQPAELQSPKPTIARNLVGRFLNPRIISAILLLVIAVSLYLQRRFDPRVLFKRGLVGIQEKDLVQVSRSATELSQHKAYQRHADFFRAYIAIQNGELDRAMRLAMQASEHPDIELEAAVLAGEAAYKMGATGNAKLLWEGVLLKEPNFVPAHQWLGAMFYDIGAMSDSIFHLEQVSKLSPNDARPDRLMGLMNRDYERPEIAIPHYRESLRRNPDQPEASQLRLEWAECHVKLREYEQALEVLKEAEPSPLKDLLTARCWLNLGMLDESRELAVRMLEGDHPKKTEALQLNAEIALADGETGKAAELLKKASEIDPFNHGVRTQLAQALGRIGESEASREQTKIAEDLQQKWQRFSDLQLDAINNQTDPTIRYQIGTLAKELGKPELAVVWFKAALAIDPSNRLAASALVEVSKDLGLRP
jgi:tetratricopeptide (TPR) repeat protein